MTTPDIYRVDQRTEEYPGTFTLEISPRENSAPGNEATGTVAQAAAARATGAQQNESCQSFQPGQFNMLYVFGAGEVPISMSGAAGSGNGYIHTIRSLGAVTQGLERLRQGDPLGVRGPFGSGWPLAETAGRQVLIIAGGLGLAPLRPAIYHLLNPGANSGETMASRVSLFYGARTPAEMLYRRELEDWSRDIEVHTTVDSADQAWAGHVGVVTSLLSTTAIDPEQTIAFICGPEIMMRFSIQELIRRGVPTTAIYISMERNMKCATGHCGHCQWGPNFICRDGPVFRYGDIASWFSIREL